MKSPPDKFIMPEAGIDTVTLTKFAGVRACGDAVKTCQFEYTVSALLANNTPLPSWMSYSQPYLTVAPVNSSQMGVHQIYLKQVRISTKTEQSFVSVILTVGCVIEKFLPPPQPSTAALTYTIFDDRKFINYEPF
jgi:hypothetical protein